MPRAAKVSLQPGRVYRTRSLARFGSHPSRLGRRLVRNGELERLSHGLFYRPHVTRFGPARPDAHELMRAFLGDDDFVFSGPEHWNALGLGTTAVSPARLVYNKKRSGEFEFAGQRFLLRRVTFPARPTPEWYVVDLLENLALASADAATVGANLSLALRERRFDLDRLREMAERFGTHRTVDLIERAASEAAA